MNRCFSDPPELSLPFPTASFAVHAERCLNGFQRAANCRRCQAGCPAQAIEIGDGQVAVGAGCVNCGACVSDCPTEVFVETNVLENRLLAWERPPEKTLELICPLAANGATGGKTAQRSAAEAACRMTPRCLAALTPAILLSLTQSGQSSLWLNDDPCASCPIGTVHRQLQMHVREANAWLINSGRETAIYTYTMHPERLQSGWVRQAVPTHKQPGQRRAFFRKLFSLEPVDSTAIVKDSSLPRPRQKLLAWLEKVENWPAALDSSSLPVTDIVVREEACSACGLCTKSCPTQALTFVTDEAEEAFGLYFQPARCIDCGLCALACAEQAITYSDDTLTGRALLSERPVRPNAGLLRECSGCRARIATTSKHAACFICRQRTEQPAYLWTP